MKTHLIKGEYKTGEMITHFRTVCGKIRHVCTNLPNTLDISKVTCKTCLHKMPNADKITDTEYKRVVTSLYPKYNSKKFSR